MSTNCAPLLADLFDIHKRQNLFKSIYMKRKKIVSAFNLSIILTTFYHKFLSYVDWIHHRELEINDITVFHICFTVLLQLDVDGKITIQLHYERANFTFPSSTFLIYVALFHHPLHIVFISLSWSDMQELILQFLNRGRLLTNKLVLQGFLKHQYLHFVLFRTM
jgi:hypothetical protein